MNEQCLKKTFRMIIVFCLILTNFSVVVGSNNSFSGIIYVDNDGGADYTKIQDAIDAASPGDIIFVFNGLYEEKICIDKSNIELHGEDRDNTIIKGKTGKDVVFITDNCTNVTISGFTIKSRANLEIDEINEIISCIRINGNYITITDNLISSNTYSQVIRGNPTHGIGIYNSWHNIISHNIIQRSIGGIVSLNSHSTMYESNKILNNSVGVESVYSQNEIFSCNIFNNNSVGIRSIGIKNFTIECNTFYDTLFQGIFLQSSNNNNIHQNYLNNNNNGIIITNSKGNIIDKNSIRFNKQSGVFIQLSENTTISNNIVSSNGLDGIYLKDSNDQLIVDCVISSNFMNGIKLQFSGTYESNTVIDGCDITDHSESGILLTTERSIDEIPALEVSTTIRNAFISQNFRGIKIDPYVTSCEIFNSYIYDNYWGVKLSESKDNLIEKCTFEDNYCGIMRGKGNTIQENNFVDNKVFHAFGEMGNKNSWFRNYWSGHNTFFPCYLYLHNIDWFPHAKPYNYPYLNEILVDDSGSNSVDIGKDIIWNEELEEDTFRFPLLERVLQLIS